MGEKTETGEQKNCPKPHRWQTGHSTHLPSYSVLLEAYPNLGKLRSHI